MTVAPTVSEYMDANPQWTYGQTVGYCAGCAASEQGNQFAGISPTDWLHAGDDYAWGYRQGYLD